MAVERVPFDWEIKTKLTIYYCELCKLDLRPDGNLDWHQDPKNKYRDCRGIGTAPMAKTATVRSVDLKKIKRP